MKLTHAEIAALCRGLSRLLHGGLSLNEGAFLLAEGEQGTLKALLTAMGEAMDSGSDLCEAMVSNGAFPPHVYGMVKVGEASGRLEEALEGLADYYDERVRTARRIRSALTYPCMILGLMMIVITVLLTKVLPVFESVYASLGVTMTGLSGGLLALGRGLGAVLPVLLALLAAAAIAGVAIWRSAGLREKITARLLSRFGDRGILRKFNNARFLRAMALGLGSGLSLEEALELSCGLLSDVREAAARCAACAEAVRAGEDVAEAMKQAGLLSPAQSRMLRLSLRSGSGDKIMAELADTAMEEAELALDNTVGRIEPAMVTVCSALVGAILLTVMLPLVDILSALGG